MRIRGAFRALCLGAALSACASDKIAAPPDPVLPAPVILPTSIVLQSDVGDYVGAGQTFSYNQANAVIEVTANTVYLGVEIKGDERWSAEFHVGSALNQLQRGTYSDLKGPFLDPTKGGLRWYGEGRSCTPLASSFTIDSLTYSGTVLTSIDLRFEQHCDGKTPALRGTIRWRANDTTHAAGPVTPSASLWRPPTGSTPPSGNYIYLESEPGDNIGDGRTYTYTQANAIIDVMAFPGRVFLRLQGDQFWFGDFQAMNTLSQLQPGYYGDLRRYPLHNPVKGGLSWHGNSRGCNTSTGWFVIDTVTYTGGGLTAFDLRFEQHCDGGGPALHGAIHWRLGDPTTPPGPVNPPPAGLWHPPVGATPTSGNYVYLESDPDDFVGAGRTLLFTAANATFEATGVARTFSIYVRPPNSLWFGNFEAMTSIFQLQPGYYTDLVIYGPDNPAKGGLVWAGDGRGCNGVTGWFVVDAVSYANGEMTSIDLRFEQHCEGRSPSLHGAIHWNR